MMVIMSKLQEKDYFYIAYGLHKESQHVFRITWK